MPLYDDWARQRARLDESRHWSDGSERQSRRRDERVRLTVPETLGYGSAQHAANRRAYRRVAVALGGC